MARLEFRLVRSVVLNLFFFFFSLLSQNHMKEIIGSL